MGYHPGLAFFRCTELGLELTPSAWWYLPKSRICLCEAGRACRNKLPQPIFIYCFKQMKQCFKEKWKLRKWRSRTFSKWRCRTNEIQTLVEENTVYAFISWIGSNVYHKYCVESLLHSFLMGCYFLFAVPLLDFIVAPCIQHYSCQCPISQYTGKLEMALWEIAQVRICIAASVLMCACMNVCVCVCVLGVHVRVCNKNQMVGCASAWFLSPISNQAVPRSTVWERTRGLECWAAS